MRASILPPLRWILRPLDPCWTVGVHWSVPDMEPLRQGDCGDGTGRDPIHEYLSHPGAHARAL